MDPKILQPTCSPDGFGGGFLFGLVALHWLMLSLSWKKSGVHHWRLVVHPIIYRALKKKSQVMQNFRTINRCSTWKLMLQKDVCLSFWGKRPIFSGELAVSLGRVTQRTHMWWILCNVQRYQTPRNIWKSIFSNNTLAESEIFQPSNWRY